MSTEAAQFVSHATKAEVVDRIEKAQQAEKRIERVNRTRKEMALATAGMGAEVVGALAGGAAVGYMQAKDHEEYAGLAAVGLGVAMGMKRLEEPSNPYWQVGFAAATGMGAAMAAGHARDYFSGGQPKAMT